MQNLQIAVAWANGEKCAANWEKLQINKDVFNNKGIFDAHT